MKKLFAATLSLLFVVSQAFATDAKNLALDGANVPFCTQDLTPSAQEFTLDSSDDSVGWVYRMPEAATITTACFRYGTRTGTPPKYKISIQGVSTSNGAPNGTILGGGSPASNEFTPPADTTWNGTWQCRTLDNSIAVARGDLIAVDIRYTATGSTTINASNFSTFTTHLHNCSNRFTIPYATRVSNGGSPSSNSGDLTTFAVKSSSRTYGSPILNHNRDQYSSDSSPDEYGMAFTLDSNWCSTVKVVGVRANIRTGNQGKTVKWALYNNTTELQNVTVDTDQIPSAVENGRMIEVYFDETTLSTLTCGTQYIVAAAPQETSNNMAIYSIESNASGELSAWGGQGNFNLATRTDSGAWTITNTKRPVIELILEDITQPAGGGGSGIKTHPGTGGGFHG